MFTDFNRRLSSVIGFVFSLCVLCSFTACRQGKTSKEEPEPKSRLVDVDVFIVMKSGESIKLGLINVYATPLETAQKAIMPLLEQRRSEMDAYIDEIKRIEVQFGREAVRLGKALAEAQVDDHKASQNLVSASKDLRKAIFDACVEAVPYIESIKRRSDISEQSKIKFFNDFQVDGLKASIEALETDILVQVGVIEKIFMQKPWEGLPEVRKGVLNSIGTLKARADAVSRNQQAVARLKLQKAEADKKALPPKRPVHTAAELFRALPAPSKSSTTNADGRCSLELTEGAWIISAYGGREMAKDKREDYFWIVPIREGDKIMLSNHNLLGDDKEPPSF